MSKRDYRLMDILEFGEALLRTQDLDPAYVMLHGSRMNADQLRRWCVAYWCFYHAGAASWLSAHRDDEFWTWMLRAAQNVDPPPARPGERWPRASERRYFRGPKCIKAVEWMANRWNRPEDLVEHLAAMSQQAGPRTERTVMEAVSELPLFGPWIGFKVADMFERVLGLRVQFMPDIGLIYKEPRAGLELWASQSGAGAAFTLEDHYAEIRKYFARLPAPPDLKRPCGPQEVETILCKWKSHMNGHYPVGKDVREISHALEGWGDVAHHLQLMLPTEMEMDE